MLHCYAKLSWITTVPACCTNRGTRKGINMYAGCPRRPINPIVRKRFVELFFTTALLRQMFHFSCNRRPTFAVFSLYNRESKVSQILVLKSLLSIFDSDLLCCWNEISQRLIAQKFKQRCIALFMTHLDISGLIWSIFQLMQFFAYVINTFHTI